MKKWSRPLFTLVLAAFLTCFIAPLIHASEASDYVDFYTAYNDYLVALNDKSKGPADVQSALSKVIEKAEKYLSKYEDKVAQNTNSVLGKLISLYYGSGKKDWDKVILYSEKLVQKSTLTDNDKIGVYLVLSDAYISSAKDMNKGAEYAENAKKLTANNKRMHSQACVLAANAYYIAKKYDPALENYLSSFESMPTVRAFKKIEDIGRIFLRNKDYSRALKAFQPICESANDGIDKKYVVECLDELGATYAKMGNAEQAFRTYSRLYSMRKNSEVAYKLGVHHNKIYQSTKDEKQLEVALKYWAEAVVLKNPASYAQQAEQILKKYWFEQKKGSQDDYNDLMAGARQRVGK